MKWFVVLSLIAGFAPVTILAQEYGTEESQFLEEAAARELPKVKGVVRRIDVANFKITLKHERIPNLDMPGMTMPFSVASPALLQGLRNGDKVHFTADTINNVLTVTWIQKTR